MLRRTVKKGVDGGNRIVTSGDDKMIVIPLLQCNHCYCQERCIWIWMDDEVTKKSQTGTRGFFRHPLFNGTCILDEVTNNLHLSEMRLQIGWETVMEKNAIHSN